MEFENEFTYRKFVESGRESEFDRLFDEAVERVNKEVLGKKFPMYIGGKEVYANEVIEEHSPIDGRLIGVFQKGTREHARQAIDAAFSAFDEWRNKSYKERVSIFRKAADILRFGDGEELMLCEESKACRLFCKGKCWLPRCTWKGGASDYSNEAIRCFRCYSSFQFPSFNIRWHEHRRIDYWQYCCL